VTEPADYGRILEELDKSGGRISLRTRFNLACKAFSHTSEYDTAIAKYLAGLDFSAIEKCYDIQQGRK